MNAFPDGRRARELHVVVARALPRERPAAGLFRHVVRAVAGNEHALIQLQRQQSVLVLQQHERFAYGFTRDRAMLRIAEHVELPAAGSLRRRTGLEQPHAHLHSQDARDGIVEPRLRDHAAANLLEQAGVERLPAIRRHVHVEPGVDRLRAALYRAAGHLTVRVPVADDEALEVHAVLQHVGEEAAIAGDLQAVPARERRHHGLHAVGDGGRITGCMNVSQRRFRDTRVALIATAFGAAIGEVVLRCREHMRRAEEVLRARIALQAAHEHARVRSDDRGIFGITLVGAAPAHVLVER